jgi:hypothetical protein
MNALPQVVSEDLIDPAVLVNAAQAFQTVSHDPDAEVAFAQRMAACMARVLVAFVDNVQPRRTQCYFQLLLDSCANRSQIRHLSNHPNRLKLRLATVIIRI